MIEIIVLALIQGLTEFLPISSSAHLILPSQLLGWPDQGLAFDVAVHVGTLLAVIWYFRAELARMIGAWFGSLRGRRDADSTLAWQIIAATIPAAVAGLLINDLVESVARSMVVIATTTIVFGLALWWADTRPKTGRDEYQLGWGEAIMIGCAQAIALIPGVSRSGITLTAALAFGLSRTGAARFSFLMSIPIIGLAGGYKILQLAQEGGPIAWNGMALGAALAFASGLACIHFLLKLLERMSLMPFVVYRVLLGLALFALVGYRGA